MAGTSTTSAHRRKSSGSRFNIPPVTVIPAIPTVVISAAPLVAPKPRSASQSSIDRPIASNFLMPPLTTAAKTLRKSWRAWIGSDDDDGHDRSAAPSSQGDRAAEEATGPNMIEPGDLADRKEGDMILDPNVDGEASLSSEKVATTPAWRASWERYSLSAEQDASNEEAEQDFNGEEHAVEVDLAELENIARQDFAIASSSEIEEAYRNMTTARSTAATGPSRRDSRDLSITLVDAANTVIGPPAVHKISHRRVDSSQFGDAALKDESKLNDPTSPLQTLTSLSLLLPEPCPFDDPPSPSSSPEDSTDVTYAKVKDSYVRRLRRTPGASPIPSLRDMTPSPKTALPPRPVPPTSSAWPHYPALTRLRPPTPPHELLALSSSSSPTPNNKKTPETGSATRKKRGKRAVRGRNDRTPSPLSLPGRPMWTAAPGDLLTSRPANLWGASKRWTCCRCRGRTIVEQAECAKGVCGHARCERGCVVIVGAQ